MHVWQQTAQGSVRSAAMFLSALGLSSSACFSLSLSPSLSMSHTHTHSTVTSCHTFASEVQRVPQLLVLRLHCRHGPTAAALAQLSGLQTNTHGHILGVALTPPAHRVVLMPDNERWAPLSPLNTAKSQHSCAEQR